MEADAKLTRRERALRYALIFMALVFAGFIVAYLVDGTIFDIDDYKTKVTEFPFVANAVTKDGLFLAITLIAIGNLRRFGWLTLVVILGHVMLIASLGLMLLTGNTDEPVCSRSDPRRTGSARHSSGAAWTSWSPPAWPFYRRAQLPPSDLFASPTEQLTKREGYLRFGLGVMAVVFAGFIVAYVVDGVNSNGQFPFVANSVTKDGLFLAITLLAISNLRRFGWMTLLVIMGT